MTHSETDTDKKVLNASPAQNFARLSNLSFEERREVIMHSKFPEITAENFRNTLDPMSVMSDVELFGKELPEWIG